MKANFEALANLIYETGTLERTERSGFWFLGTGRQSVAAHSYRATVIAFLLAKLEYDVDVEKVLVMSLFHDFAEARTSDLNYVHQKYNETDEKKATEDAFKKMRIGGEIIGNFKELKEKETKEARIVKDADDLELLATLRVQQENGNKRVDDWIKNLLKRLTTKNGKILAQYLLDTHPDDWWFDRDGDWWVDRNKSKL